VVSYHRSLRRPLLSAMLALTSILVFWLGPPLTATIAGMVFFSARRRADSANPVPWNEFWSAAMLWGVVGTGIWIGLVALLLIVTRAGNAGLWIVFVPWAFAAGEVYGIFRLSKRMHGSGN
jgi:hypothetical protein